MPRSNEPFTIQWARVRSAWWDIFIVLGEEITRLALRAKFRADREVLNWMHGSYGDAVLELWERERNEDEKH